jgi:hypothetical protein
MHSSVKLICAAAILSAATVPAFADAAGAGPGQGQIMMMMSNGTMSSMAMPTDKMAMHKMMMGAHKMKGCFVVMNVAGNRGGMYYMMATDKQCGAMSKG